MNDEYLWSKTGDDEDVRELESLLSVFRQPESALPPRLPVAEEANRFGWLLSLRMRLTAGFAVIAIIAVGAFLVLRSVPTVQTARSDESEVAEPLNSFPVVDPTAVAGTEPGSEADAPTAKLTSEQKVSVTRVRSARQVRPQSKTIVARAVRPQRQVKLTAEEKFAYDQLKLALAISGSKLKIVRDVISGNDPQQSKDTSTNR